MVTCLDSSALVRLCVGEGDLTVVKRAMSQTPVVSVLAGVEIPAAITARFHRGSVSEVERDRLLAIANGLLEATIQIALTAAIRREAVDICRRFLLRAMDAIHLGTAVAASRQGRRYGKALRFCTADFRQAEAATTIFGPAFVDLIPPL